MQDKFSDSEVYLKTRQQIYEELAALVAVSPTIGLGKVATCLFWDGGVLLTMCCDVAPVGEKPACLLYPLEVLLNGRVVCVCTPRPASPPFACASGGVCDQHALRCAVPPPPWSRVERDEALGRSLAVAAAEARYELAASSHDNPRLCASG